MEYLNDEEKGKIIAFNKDRVLFEAVKKVLLDIVYQHGVLKPGIAPNPLKNYALTTAANALAKNTPNEIIGEHIRALWEGINLVESGFQALDKFKEAPKKDEPVPTPYPKAV